ncbi:hypothetical protein Ddc_00259 [Ditylenchus destructor]|nr:hypothetical protein Ddc_00259 [Ditylenchus destructor]
MAPVYNTLLCDVIAFNTRSEMVKLSAVSKRMSRLIVDEFPKSPYVVFDGLYYFNGSWSWIRDMDARDLDMAKSAGVLDMDELLYFPLPDEIFDILSASKFMRFQTVAFELDVLFPSQTTIESIRHVWDSQCVWVLGALNGGQEPWPFETNAFFETFSKAEKLSLKVPTSLSHLSSVLENGPQVIVIEDGTNISNVKVSSSAITNFLLKPSTACNDISILTVREFLNIHKFVEVFEAVKQAFLTANKPLRLYFWWFSVEGNVENWSYRKFDVANAKIGQRLKLDLSPHRFDLYTKPLAANDGSSDDE